MRLWNQNWIINLYQSCLHIENAETLIFQPSFAIEAEFVADLGGDQNEDVEYETIEWDMQL